VTLLIETRGLTIDLSGQTVLKHVDFAVTRGEIVVIVGPNGSGKTTFLRALIGAVKPSSGSAYRKPDLRIGYVPQRLTVDKTMPLQVADFLSLPQSHSREDISKALQTTGAEGLGKRQLSELSGGQFQKAVLARAILGQPDVLVLDEPTQGLDQPGEADFYKLIEDIRQEIGCAIILVSHDLHVVMRAADRVICLNGHICCEGAPTAVATAPEYQALFGHGTKGTLALYRHEHDHHHHDHSNETIKDQSH
jgi:zinc transport system ATP-binding protein